ncbi:MAG TPA: Sec-independent protein translocase subunit TatB [Epsilonproteobacteria bacterium]|nr:Sec-independent protein translocase subunit TatB [Campylobacterota bacterium]
MFGIGFTELLLIAIIAILFLGPDKLPSALVEMAKFIKSVKKTIGEAKSSLEEEMKIADLKEEALNYKKQLNDATAELQGFKNINFDSFDDVNYDKKETTATTNITAKTEEAPLATTQVEAKNETVTFKKKPKKEENTPKSTKGDA